MNIICFLLSLGIINKKKTQESSVTSHKTKFNWEKKNFHDDVNNWIDDVQDSHGKVTGQFIQTQKSGNPEIDFKVRHK